MVLKRTLRLEVGVPSKFNFCLLTAISPFWGLSRVLSNFIRHLITTGDILLFLPSLPHFFTFLLEVFTMLSISNT
jgi:hypothetical protein